VPPWRSVAAGLAVGGLGYGASLVLYIRSARELGAARSQMYFAAAPFIGALLSWGALGDRLWPAQLLALGALGAGLGLLFTEQHRHGHQHTAQAHTHAHRHDDAHHLHTHVGLAPGAEHTHAHTHEPVAHEHPHAPDLHHRHAH
jgi:hypothetical protein